MVKKYSKVRTIFSVVAFLIIFSILFHMFSYVLRDKTAANRMYPYFKEKKNTIDTLFIGASAVDEGISPMQLWEEYGVTSYNLANGGQSLPVNYWCLKVALKTQKPKVVVLDLRYLFMQDKLANQPNRLYQFTDNIPFSLDKIQCILDCAEPDSWADYLMNIRVYHLRWKELTQTDFSKISTKNKGGSINFTEGSKELSDTLQVLLEEDKGSLEDYSLSLSYIEKMQKLCKENNCELVAINLPSYATGETNYEYDGEALQRMWNAFADWAAERELVYLNMLHSIDEIGINFTEDYYNWGHPNYFGNQKLTSYLGNILTDNYSFLPDHRGDEEYADWQRAYEEYAAWAESKQLQPQKN